MANGVIDLVVAIGLILSSDGIRVVTTEGRSARTSPELSLDENVGI